MPAKKTKTDWKRMLQQEGYGRELLAKGARSSTGNDGDFNDLDNLPTDKAKMDAVLQMLQGNLNLRAAKRKRPYHPKLKGMFGGGE